MAGFFARKVLLVEGPTEALAIPLYLERVGLNTSKEGIAVIPVHGVGNLAKWWRLFTAYNIPTYITFDNDAAEDDKGQRRMDILRTLGIDETRHEELLTTRDWAVEDGFGIFGGSFESVMRDVFGQKYMDLEEAARDEYALSGSTVKPLVAKHVAERASL